MGDEPDVRDLERELSLAEMVNRVLDRGAVVTGDVTIGIAGVDLIHLGLQVVLSAVESEYRRGGGRRVSGDEQPEGRPL